ncbi:MAG: hypothetical protein JOY54_10535 [Acidobacteriaceae bacterium]|nr:hypothetical protein [Acidobacteriaceae bacterium]
MRTMSPAFHSEELAATKAAAIRKHELVTPYRLMLWLGLVLGLILARAANAQTPGTWNAAGNMSVVRQTPTAALLQDGTVLVVGGASSAASDVYNPSTNTWTTVGSMSTGRTNQAGVVLADGRVLVAGGVDPNGVTLASAEIYNPATKSWTLTGSMTTPRSMHSASLLSNGKVLVAGGWPTPCCSGPPQYPLATSELWDPSTGKWTATGSMANLHANHTATVLTNGDVLVSGGENYGQGAGPGVTADTEMYNPTSGTWSQVGSMTTARDYAAAALMADGRVLEAGGSAGGCCSGLATAETFDPGSLTWTAVQSMSTGRKGPAGSAISSGNDVLLSGGYSCCSDPNPTRSSSEYFQLASQTWHLTGSLITARAYHTSITLLDGTVLAVGGGFSSAERYYPDTSSQSVTIQITGNVAPATYTVAGTGCSPGTYTGYPNVAVNWNPGASCQVTATGPSGYVFTNWADGSTANPRTFIAPSTPTTYTADFSQSSATPSSIKATGGTPQSATINTAFASRLSATVTSSSGNAVSGVLVTFTAPGSGASGSFAGGANTATTNSSGVATSAVFTANAKAGSYTVTASVAGVSTSARFSLTNKAGTAASITASGGTPQSAAVNTAFSASLAATVKDAGGNPVSGVTVTFTPPSSGASGTFASGVNTATTNASGVATSAVFTANATAGSYTVTASVAGVSTQASFALTNTASGGGGGQSTVTLVPSSYVTTVGTDGGQPVATSIDLLDESGTASDWNKYVEFQNQYAGYQVFTLPSSVAPASVTNIQVEVNYQGPATSSQTWTWQIYNWVTASYVTVGTNAGAPDWGAWKLLTFTVPGTLSNYVRSSDGQMRIQLLSNNSNDAADIDYEALIVTY